MLDREVSWQGLREEWVFEGRDQGTRDIPLGLEVRWEIDALEFTRLDDKALTE